MTTCTLCGLRDHQHTANCLTRIALQPPIAINPNIGWTTTTTTPNAW